MIRKPTLTRKFAVVAVAATISLSGIALASATDASAASNPNALPSWRLLKNTAQESWNNEVLGKPSRNASWRTNQRFDFKTGKKKVVHDE